jgi:hypothetical protein
VLGEVGGGPERPDFASIQGGRRGYAGRCSQFWLDSLNADDADDVAKLLDAFAWRRVHCNSRALSTMVRWFSMIFQSLIENDGGPRKGGEHGGSIAGRIWGS